MSTGSTKARALRRQLRGAYIPFFGRFGGLTEVQLATIPEVLAGHDVLVASPTASGKTEAVVAPLAELASRDHWEGPACVYVVPTRALVNDLHVRLKGPLAECGIRLAAKHGDHPRLPTIPPDWILTTPESLDSLLTRNEALFRGLRAVVLDEVHLVDGTYRGDQLRILIGRASKLASHPLRTYLMTATAARPDQLAARYAPSSRIVQVAGQRAIDSTFVDGIEDLYPTARERGWNKILCFCNRRARVEEVAARLSETWSPYPVVAHHGSLSRKMREEAEQVLRENQRAVCVATSTLELGIDIGDVDAVALLEIPWSVDSLLQRIGRGNRRNDVCNVVIIAEDSEQSSIAHGMLSAAEEGRFDTPEYEPDLSVIVQQLFSYLFAHPSGASPDDLVDLASPLCERVTVELILDHLRREGQLEYRSGAWMASTQVMDMGEKGVVHSNIPNSEDSMTVVDTASGRSIGSVSGTVDGQFVLGRRVWRIVSVREGKISVAPGKGAASAPRFRAASSRGAFHRFLPPSLKSQPRD
jgi:ATP-dependent Lhr-like helicase